VNHTRALARLAEAVGVGVGEARPDMTCRCGELLSVVPIASESRLPEPPLAEGPARDTGNQIFGERLDATARSLND
jgi:hypothetical protein